MSSLRQIHSKFFKESGSSFSLKSVSLAVAKRLYSTPASKPKKRRLNPALGFDYVCTSSLAKKKKAEAKGSYNSNSWGSATDIPLTNGQRITNLFFYRVYQFVETYKAKQLWKFIVRSAYSKYWEPAKETTFFCFYASH